MTIRRWFIATCVGLVLALCSPEFVLSQGGPPSDVPPGFPPGLHDRVLPPGKPFDFGGFDPPGRRDRASLTVTSTMLAAANEAGTGLAAGIRTGRLDPGSGAAHLAIERLERALDEAGKEPRRLVGAVEAYNELIRASSLDFLAQPPGDLRSVRQALLDLPGVQAAGFVQTAGLVHTTREEVLRQQFLLIVSEEILLEAADRRVIPGMAANTPIGFGADFGHVWAGASYQPRARRSDGHTGAAALGFGLGDAERYAGLQVGVNSFSTVSSGFWNRSAVDLHLHRRLPGGFGVAVGWESAYTWGSGDVTKDSGSNRYAVASRWFTLDDDPGAYFSAAMLSIGVGDGRFQSERDFMEGRKGVGLFGSAAVRVAPPMSVIAEWTGQDLMVASALTPFKKHRVGIIAGVADVTGAAGDGARFVVGMTAGHSFR